VLTPASLEELKREALDPERFNRQAKLQLFDYAATHQAAPLLRALADLKFNPAKDPAAHLAAIETRLYADYRTKDYLEVKRKSDRHGVNFRNPLNQTPLMVAAWLGLDDLAGWLMANGADPRLTDNWGRTPLQIALRQAYRSESFARRKIGKLYPLLAPPDLKLKSEGRLVKLDAHRMEYFLINSMLAVLQDIYREKIRFDAPAFQTGDFVHALQFFPDHVIPPHRKHRTALTARLAGHEYHRDDPANRRLFLRVGHGRYILNPTLELDVGGEWVNVYDLFHLRELAREEKDPAFRRAAQFILDWRDRAAASVPPAAAGQDGFRTGPFQPL